MSKFTILVVGLIIVSIGFEAFTLFLLDSHLLDKKWLTERLVYILFLITLMSLIKI